MPVPVIGGTGFVGSRAVTRLSRLGHEIVVAHRGRTEADLPPEVRHVHHPALDLLSDRFVVDAVDDLFWCSAATAMGVACPATVR